jgi:hypothetical protein
MKIRKRTLYYGGTALLLAFFVLALFPGSAAAQVNCVCLPSDSAPTGGVQFCAVDNGPYIPNQSDPYCAPDVAGTATSDISLTTLAGVVGLAAGAGGMYFFMRRRYDLQK